MDRDRGRGDHRSFRAARSHQRLLVAHFHQREFLGDLLPQCKPAVRATRDGFSRAVRTARRRRLVFAAHIAWAWRSLRDRPTDRRRRCGYLRRHRRPAGSAHARALSRHHHPDDGGRHSGSDQRLRISRRRAWNSRQEHDDALDDGAAVGRAKATRPISATRSSCFALCYAWSTPISAGGPGEPGR